MTLNQSIAKRGQSNPAFKHGGVCGGPSPTYKSWASMISRCRDPKHKSWSSYGGKGVKICERWLADFGNFLADMGERPSLQHTLDRFPDRDGDYEPGNCRWATKSQQGQNRRTNVLIEYQGESICLEELARRLGLKQQTLWYRVKHGWSLQRIVSTKVKARPA